MADNQLRFEVNLNVDQAVSISVSVNESVDPAVLRNMFAAVVEGTQKQPSSSSSSALKQQPSAPSCPHPHPISTSASSSLSSVAPSTATTKPNVAANCHHQQQPSSSHPHHQLHHHHNKTRHSHHHHRYHPSSSKDDIAATSTTGNNKNSMSVRERVAQLNSSRPSRSLSNMYQHHHHDDRPSSSMQQQQQQDSQQQHGRSSSSSILKKPPHDMNVTFYSEKREFSSYPAVLLAASGIGGTSKGTSTRASTSGVSNVGATTQNNNNNEEEDEEEEECSRLHAQHSDHSHLRSTRRFMDDADMDAMDRATKGGVTGATENDDDDDDEFESSRRLRNQLYKRHHKTLRVNKSLPPKVTLNDVNDMVFETTATTTTNTTTTTTSTNTDDDDDGDGDLNNDEGEDGDDNVVTNTGQDNNKKPNTSGVTTTTEQQQQQGPFAQSSSFASSPTLTSHARSLRRPSDVSAIVHNNRRSDNNNNRKSDVIGPLSLPLKKNGGTRMNSTLGLMSCNTTDANTSCAVTPTTVVARKRNNEDEGMKNHSNLNESSEVTATEDEISSAILLTRNGTVTANHAADGHGNNNNNNIGLNKSISAAAIVSGGGNVNHLHQQHHHHSSARSHGGCSVAGGGMNTTTNSTAGSGIMGSTHDDIDDWNDYMLHEPSYAGGLAGSAHGSRPSGSGGPSDGGTGSGGPVNTSTSVPFPGSNNHAGEVNGGMALGGGGGMGSSLVGPTPGIAATRPGGGGGIVRPPGPLLFDDDESQLEKGEIPAVTTRMARFPLLSHISSRIGRTSCVGSSTNTATTSTTALTHGKRLGGSRRTAAFRSGGGIEEIHQGTLAEGLPVYSRDTIGRSRNLFGRGCGTGNGSKHGVEWLELSSPMEREELMDEVESVANKLNYDTRRVKGEDRIRCVKVLSHRKEMHMHIDFRSVNIPNEKCTVIRIVRPRSDRNRTDAWRYSHFYRELSETLNIRNIPLRN